jgi:Leucine-rich repeat (LRR) protein
MDFTNSKFLNFPDVSRIPNLEKLCLDYCKNLVEVHDSVGFLDKLVELSFEACYNLSSFPRSLKSKSLRSLNLGHCSSLKKFPEIECQMDYLVYISCNFSGIEELPSSFGYAVGVETLDLDGCKKLKNLPDSIRQLQHLKVLSLKGCIRLKELPSSMRYVGRIKMFSLRACTNLQNVPDSIYQLAVRKISFQRNGGCD